MIYRDLQYHFLIRQMQTLMDMTEDSSWQRGRHCVHKNVLPQEIFERPNISILRSKCDSSITVGLLPVIITMRLVYNRCFYKEPERGLCVPPNVPEARRSRHCHLATCLHYLIFTNGDILDQLVIREYQFGVHIYICNHHIVEIRQLLLNGLIEGHNN